MIRDQELWKRFEAKLSREKPASLEENLRIVEALYQEARGLGVFPSSDPLEGIEVDIKVARVVNSV
ncbi:MAG: hypothetical protein ACLFVT_07080 [Syntrophobacteria bacterium]